MREFFVVFVEFLIRNIVQILVAICIFVVLYYFVGAVSNQMELLK